MDRKTIAIVAEDDFLQTPLKKMVSRMGFEVIEFAKTSDLIRLRTAVNPDLLLLSFGINFITALKAAREIRQHDQNLPIILIVANSLAEIGLKVQKVWRTDYLKSAFLSQELEAKIKSVLTAASSDKSQEIASVPSSDDLMLGKSPTIIRMMASLKKLASTDCTVLITGETGTGKELAAKMIHRHSPRAGNPFVVINCAAIPDSLMESELFGYEKGAFTGAHSRRTGAISSGHLGTVFFDEIGDMSLYGQAKLLRTLENREIWPVGGRKSQPVNVRFLAASNRDLEQLIREGKFRPDLFYRLNVARVLLPPLRERKEDIPLLLDYFRQKLNIKFGKEIEGFSEEAVAVLMNHDWPGNIRELKNLLEATVINASRKVTLDDFPEIFRRGLEEAAGLHQNERRRLLAALFQSNWNKTKAAQRLNWSRMTLYRKLAKYNLTTSFQTEKSYCLEMAPRLDG